MSSQIAVQRLVIGRNHLFFWVEAGVHQLCRAAEEVTEKEARTGAEPVHQPLPKEQIEDLNATAALVEHISSVPVELFGYELDG